MEVADKYKKLNRAQREAACHGAGPLLILAGAGTGKTNTLAHRVAHLVVSGVDPRRIMLLTFSVGVAFTEQDATVKVPSGNFYKKRAAAE